MNSDDDALAEIRALVDSGLRARAATPTRLFVTKANETPQRPSEEWSAVWFALSQHAWSSLAVVPAHPSVSALHVSCAIAEIGQQYEEGGVMVLDAERVAPETVRNLSAGLDERGSARQRTLVAVSSPLVDPAAVPVVRMADAAVLVVPLGTTELDWARRTIASISAGYFLGSITTVPR
jgi:hypothetical protein